LETSIQKQKTNPAALFVDWLLIGIQSFGGGAPTFSLVHQVAIQRGWLTEEEFVRSWALVQISPGINLVKLTVLIGYDLAGWAGILAAVGGFMLPSALVTVLMTAGFDSIRSVPWIQASMKGVIPATIGLSFSMGIQMAQPIFSIAKNDGPARIGAHILILICAGLLMAVGQVSPLVILILSGILAIILFSLTPISTAAAATGDRP
jgi:chromate transporter